MDGSQPAPIVMSHSRPNRTCDNTIGVFHMAAQSFMDKAYEALDTVDTVQHLGVA